MTERALRRIMITVALTGLALGVVAMSAGNDELARWLWAAGTAPVSLALLVSMIRDLLAGRMGVDAVAVLSMSAAGYSDRLNTVVRKNSAYADAMPLLPGLGTGLSPLLQWLFVPPLASRVASKLCALPDRRARQ